MLQIDKKYEKAIRYYLDSILDPQILTVSQKTYDTNIAKSLNGYIRDFSNNPGYKFTTPLSCLWNFTSACNFRCVHCLYNDTEYSAANDLSHDDAIRLADELINDFNITYVVLTGGEIFMRKDIMDIIRKFKENNVGVRLQTNAALINNAQIEELAELFNPYTDSIHISYDGATAETFKKIRQTKHFNTIIANTKKLVSKNVRILAVCTINSINYNEICDIYKLCADIGVYEFIAAKTVLYNESHKNLMVSNQDLFMLYSKLLPLKTDSTRLTAAFFTPFEILNIPEAKQIIEENKYQQLIDNKYKEIASRNCHYHDKIAIQSDGTVYLCLEALSHDIAPLGNYKQNSLSKIWENRHNNILFQERNIEDMNCYNCRYNKYCNSGCMVKSIAWANNINTPQGPCSLI